MSTRGLQIASLELYAPHQAFPQVTSASPTGRSQSGSELRHLLTASSPDGHLVIWEAVDPLPAWLSLENHGGGMARLIGIPPPGTNDDLLLRLAATSTEVGPTYNTFTLRFNPHTPWFNMSTTPTGADLRMEWFGYSGVHYQIEVSDDLKEWIDLGPLQQGSDAPISLDAPMSETQPRFFRIRYTQP